MPKQAKVILYSVDELNAIARRAAVKELEDSAYNVSHDWWEQPTLRCEEALNMAGFSEVKIRFDVEQDDGALFTGNFERMGANNQALAEKYPELAKALKHIKSALLSDMGNVKAKVRRIRGTHLEKDAVAVCDVEFNDNIEYDVVAIQHELDNFNPDEWESDEHGEAAKELMQSRIETAIGLKANIVDYLTKIKDTLCDFIYKELRSEFDHLCSEDAIIETMRCEKMLFLVDGTRAPDFLADDAVDVLEFEDILADGSIEGHGYLCAEDDNYVYTISEVTFADDNTTGFEVDVTVVNDGEFITSRACGSVDEAKLWAAKYSLGER